MADLTTPMSIRVAATLSLVERAGSAGATAEQLASATGTATPALRCLLDHLVAIGVFDLDIDVLSAGRALCEHPRGRRYRRGDRWCRSDARTAVAVSPPWIG